MNTTFFGKVLIFVNLVLSVAASAWAIGLFTNRIDWPGVGSDKAMGEYTRRDAAVKKAQQAASLALTRWQDATKTVNAYELQRPANQNWYAEQLKALEDGSNAVTSLKFNNNQQLLPGQVGGPIKGPGGQDLQSRATIREGISKVESDIQKIIAQAQAAILVATDLTYEIEGNKPNAANPKGLRDLLREQEQARANAQAELENLKPSLYNRLGEAELLQKRQNSMKHRLSELETSTKAALR